MILINLKIKLTTCVNVKIALLSTQYCTTIKDRKNKINIPLSTYL